MPPRLPLLQTLATLSFSHPRKQSIHIRRATPEEKKSTEKSLGEENKSIHAPSQPARQTLRQCLCLCQSCVAFPSLLPTPGSISLYTIHSLIHHPSAPRPGHPRRRPPQSCPPTRARRPPRFRRRLRRPHLWTRTFGRSLWWGTCQCVPFNRVVTLLS
jgi:hypothetical protein